MPTLRDMYQTNPDGSYVPFETTAAETQSNTLPGGQSYAEWMLSQRPDAGVTTPKASVPDPSAYDLANYNTPANGGYNVNADGSYAPFETAQGDPARTATGGYVNNVIPDIYTYPGSLIQTAQQMGVNPDIYGSLNLQASYAPEFQNLANVGNASTTTAPERIDLQSGQVDNQTPLQNASAGFLSRLANEQSDPAHQQANIANQQQWNSHYMNSGNYNPNGANAYAIQHNLNQTPTPFFTNNAPNPYNPGGTVENPTTKLPATTNAPAAVTNVPQGDTSGFGGYYDEYGFGNGPKYNQFDQNKQSNKNQGWNPNFGRPLWRN